jgi:hypothetical protein
VNDVHVNCASCGIEFCLPRDVYERRREDHETFYCPSGHRNHYLRGLSPKEKRIAELERLAARRLEIIERRDDQIAGLLHELRSLRSRLAWARRRAA